MQAEFIPKLIEKRKPELKPDAKLETPRASGGDMSALLNSSPRVQGLVQMKDALNRPPKANATAMPDSLKSGVENLSGISMGGVKVHYNSPAPSQLNAHAYAQGSEIHLAPGQERHLPHEAWHVVQQAQGRVKPTVQMTQMKGATPVNDDPGLEQEADVMGQRAAATDGSASPAPSSAGTANPGVVQGVFAGDLAGKTAQQAKVFIEGRYVGVAPFSRVSGFLTSGESFDSAAAAGALGLQSRADSSASPSVAMQPLPSLSSSSSSAPPVRVAEGGGGGGAPAPQLPSDGLVRSSLTAPSLALHEPLPLHASVSSAPVHASVSSVPVPERAPGAAQEVVNRFDTTGLFVTSIQTAHLPLFFANAVGPGQGVSGGRVDTSRLSSAQSLHPTVNFTLAHRDLVANYYKMADETGSPDVTSPTARSLAPLVDPSQIGDKFLSNDHSRLAFGADASSSSGASSAHGKPVFSQEEAAPELDRLLGAERTSQAQRPGRPAQNTEIKTLGFAPDAVVGFLTTKAHLGGNDIAILQRTIAASRGARQQFPVFTWMIAGGQTVLHFLQFVSRPEAEVGGPERGPSSSSSSNENSNEIK